jgi:hypothetical protein
VAKASNSSKNITTSAVRFTVTASGKDSVVLSGAVFNITSNYTASSDSYVRVYKNSVSTDNLV